MDKYERLKKIGEGSFGKAILVKSKKDGKLYVIKEISICGMSSKQMQESRREVAVLANMSHPNIVQYRESFEEAGCLYIVMDYCEGGDMFKKINSQRGVLFSEDQVLDWLVQICLALKHIHDRKILHRDIKSQNIFLTKDGTLQLGDFGIARVLNSTVELAKTCIGTPYYLSPEICENKPYNNKSDIWALGCVLYEMCTLKHAFEAGNMKNLVVKIIRGSYPPVSPLYSADLRLLLAQLFKRSPRERPSVSAILHKPFLWRRIPNVLPPQIFAQEFSHAVLVNQPKGGPVAPVKRPAPGHPAQKITKPAAKYGVPLSGRKCGDRKLSVNHKPADLPNRRASHGEEERRKLEEIQQRKRVEQMDKKQREQMFLLKAGHMKRFEKEKIIHINRAREQGWRHVLSSSGGFSPERKFYAGGGGIAPTSPERKVQQDQAKRIRMEPMYHSHSQESSPARQPNGPPDHRAVQRELQRLEMITKRAIASRQRGPAAERARQVEEFLQRKKEAMLNKARAEGQLGAMQQLVVVYGGRPLGVKPEPDGEEEEYLARLRQIRLQNFNERQQIKARLRGEKCESDGSDSQESGDETEIRRKKIEVLKAQAQTRAAVLKEHLEKKRREAYEREKKAWEDHLVARGVKATPAEPELPSPLPSGPCSQEKPVTPAISMTTALKEVGVEPLLPQPDSCSLQCEKLEILRKLNLNIKTQVDQEGQAYAGDRDRRKWQALAQPLVCLAEEALEESGLATAEHTSMLNAADRKRWQAGSSHTLSVAKITLEESCISAASVSTAVQAVQHESAHCEELVCVGTENTHTAQAGSVDRDAETHETVADIEGEGEELEVLELPKTQTSHKAPVVVNAWLAESQQPLEAAVSPAEAPADGDTTEAQSRGQHPPAGQQEPLFHRLPSCRDELSTCRSRDSLLIGLSTGMFDTNNPQMLRTCSLPDLTKLFISDEDKNRGHNGLIVPHDNLQLEDVDDEPLKEDDSEAEEDNVYEDGDEDLQQLRASMERLLQEQPSKDRGDSEDKGVGWDRVDKNDGGGKEDAGEDKDDRWDKANGADEEDGQNKGDRQDKEDGGNMWEKEDEGSRALETEEVAHSSGSELNEEWHSDDSDGGDASDSDHHDSIFNRLEELRCGLEQDMGLERFIQAYRQIKAIHEDEDESVDLGPSMVHNVLGSQHQHLYPKILQLVMADGAYEEDNAE